MHGIHLRHSNTMHDYSGTQHTNRTRRIEHDALTHWRGSRQHMALARDTRSEHDGENTFPDCYLTRAHQTRPDPLHVFLFWQRRDRAVSPMRIFLRRPQSRQRATSNERLPRQSMYNTASQTNHATGVQQWPHHLRTACPHRRASCSNRLSCIKGKGHILRTQVNVGKPWPTSSTALN